MRIHEAKHSSAATGRASNEISSIKFILIHFLSLLGCCRPARSPLAPPLQTPSPAVAAVVEACAVCCCCFCYCRRYCCWRSCVENKVIRAATFVDYDTPSPSLQTNKRRGLRRKNATAFCRSSRLAVSSSILSFPIDHHS